MPPSITNFGRVTLTGLQLPSLASDLAHFLTTESGTSPETPTCTMITISITTSSRVTLGKNLVEAVAERTSMGPTGKLLTGVRN
jgi:hypothetical protein